MSRHLFYIGVIVVLIGFNAVLLKFYTKPHDCSKTAEVLSI